MNTTKPIIVITGSTSGIGKELVKLFAKTHNVFAGYRNSSLIEPMENVDYFYIDMTDRKSISDAGEYIISKTEKVDILINAAGCVIAGAFEFIDTDRLRHQFEVNTFSHIEFSQKLTPVLENGRIVNISSMASFGQFPFISPYCASKRALDIFFNAFAIENHKNIEVVSVKPGVIATPLWQKSVDNNIDSMSNCSEYEKEFEFLKTNALKNSSRGLNVEDVANFIKKVALVKNPKPSYTIGIDAKLAHLLSYLPQGFVNRLVKLGMKWRSR